MALWDGREAAERDAATCFHGYIHSDMRDIRDDDDFRHWRGVMKGMRRQLRNLTTMPADCALTRTAIVRPSMLRMCDDDVGMAITRSGRESFGLRRMCKTFVQFSAT